MARRIKEHEESSSQQLRGDLYIFKNWVTWRKWVGLIVPCLFQYKNDGIPRLTVGKPKTKKTRWFWFFFSEDTQLSCRTCQKDAVDAKSSHQGEIVQFHGKEIPSALLKKKKKGNFLSHKLFGFGRVTWESVNMCLAQSALCLLSARPCSASYLLKTDTFKLELLHTWCLEIFPGHGGRGFSPLKLSIQIFHFQDMHLAP